MQFIKIGNKIINPAHIVWVSTESVKLGEKVFVTLTSSVNQNLELVESEVVSFTGDEAKAFLSWVNEPDNCVDLTSGDPALEHWREHQRRGGTWNLQFFRQQFNRHQEWVQQESPSDALIEKTIQLEGELLCF